MLGVQVDGKFGPAQEHLPVVERQPGPRSAGTGTVEQSGGAHRARRFVQQALIDRVRADDPIHDDRPSQAQPHDLGLHLWAPEESDKGHTGIWDDEQQQPHHAVDNGVPVRLEYDDDVDRRQVEIGQIGARRGDADGTGREHIE